MQSSSILELPHSPTSKQDFEKFVKQQKVDKSNSDIPISTSTETTTSSFGPTSFFYKLTEIVAITSATISETYSTLTAGGTIEPKPSTRRRRDYNNGSLGDVMQINDDSDGAYDDDEMSEVEAECDGEGINKKTSRKDDKWTVNDDEEEPPPPYDSSWSMPKSSTYNAETTPEPKNLEDAPVSSPKCTDSHVEDNSTSTPKDVQYSTTVSPRRRQIRVGRPRRLLRKKSALTEASTPTRGGSVCDDPDKLLLKVNDKLSDMIAQGRAALTSTVEITEVDILLAEEKEREEKIMKELGLQTPVGRRGRKNTAFSEYDYFTSMSDGNYSPPESSSCEFGYGAYNGHHGNGFVPNGYIDPNVPKGFSNGPISSFGGPARFGRFGPNNNNGGFAPNYGPIPSNVDYSSPECEYGYGAYNGHGNGFSNGFAEPNMPKGFGTGPVSGGFGSAARFGRFGPNNNNGGFGTNYIPPTFGSTNVGGYNMSGVYNNNNREFIY